MGLVGLLMACHAGLEVILAGLTRSTEHPNRTAGSPSLRTLYMSWDLFWATAAKPQVKLWIEVRGRSVAS